MVYSTPIGRRSKKVQCQLLQWAFPKLWPRVHLVNYVVNIPFFWGWLLTRLSILTGFHQILKPDARERACEVDISGSNFPPGIQHIGQAL